MAKVLVTGSAGAVGVPVCRELLRSGHEVTGFDLRASECASQSVIGDITDVAALQRAMQGIDTVIHLAAQAHDVDFMDLVSPNVVGLYQVMNAARHAAVRRIVLASSIQVTSDWDQQQGPAPVTEANPKNHYGLTKLWAEQLGALYARRFNLSVIAVRIAWMVRDLAEARKLRQWNRPELYLSRDDLGRFFALCVSAPDITFEVLYACSKEGEARWDMEPARRVLGYNARDRFPEGLGFELPNES
jgi:nucleoside-diphosphate-sugar epimerase